MHDMALYAFIDCMKAIAEEMIVPEGLPHAGEKIIKTKLDIACFSLTDRGEDLLAKLVSDVLIRKHRWTEKYTEKLIKEKLDSVLHQVVQRRDTVFIEPAVRSIVDEYESSN